MVVASTDLTVDGRSVAKKSLRTFIELMPLLSTALTPYLPIAD
jgi:hypothetical protein